MKGRSSAFTLVALVLLGITAIWLATPTVATQYYPAETAAVHIYQPGQSATVVAPTETARSAPLRLASLQTPAPLPVQQVRPLPSSQRQEPLRFIHLVIDANGIHIIR